MKLSLERHNQLGISGYTLVGLLIGAAILLSAISVTVQISGIGNSLLFTSQTKTKLILASRYLTLVLRDDIQCNQSLAAISLANPDTKYNMLTNAGFLNSPMGQTINNLNQKYGYGKISQLNLIRNSTLRDKVSPNNNSPYEVEVQLVVDANGKSLIQRVGYISLILNSSYASDSTSPCKFKPLYLCPLSYSGSCGDASQCESTCMGQLQSGTTCVIRGFNASTQTINCTDIYEPVGPTTIYKCPLIFSNGCEDASACQSTCVGQIQSTNYCMYRTFNGVPLLATCPKLM